MKTRAQLVNRALSLLGVVGAGQTSSAEDFEAVDAAVEPKLEELSARGVMYVADPEEIEPAAFQWLAMLVAQDVAPDFGVSMDATAIAVAESRLREIQHQGPTSAPVRATYY